jgi:hypothetical protein
MSGGSSIEKCWRSQTAATVWGEGRPPLGAVETVPCRLKHKPATRKGACRGWRIHAVVWRVRESPRTLRRPTRIVKAAALSKPTAKTGAVATRNENLRSRLVATASGLPCRGMFPFSTFPNPWQIRDTNLPRLRVPDQNLGITPGSSCVAVRRSAGPRGADRGTRSS